MLWRPEEGFVLLGAPVTGSYQLPDEGAGNRARVFWKSSKTLDGWTISPALSRDLEN